MANNKNMGPQKEGIYHMKKKHYSVNERTGEIAIGDGKTVLVEPFMQFRIDGDRWMTSKFKARELAKGCEYRCTWTVRVT